MSLTWELSSELSDYWADVEPLHYLATERLTCVRNGLYRAQGNKHTTKGVLPKLRRSNNQVMSIFKKLFVVLFSSQSHFYRPSLSYLFPLCRMYFTAWRNGGPSRLKIFAYSTAVKDFKFLCSMNKVQLYLNLYLFCTYFILIFVVIFSFLPRNVSFLN